MIFYTLHRRLSRNLLSFSHVLEYSTYIDLRFTFLLHSVLISKFSVKQLCINNKQPQLKACDGRTEAAPLFGFQYYFGLKFPFAGEVWSQSSKSFAR